jgi:hypothetical protein
MPKFNLIKMKKLVNLFLLTTIIGLLLLSCNKDHEAVPDNKKASVTNLLKDGAAIQQYVYNIMLEHGWDHCAYFVHEDLLLLKSGASFIPAGPQGYIMFEGMSPNPPYFVERFGGFGAAGGPGDWVRSNPDGTFTLQINSNEAIATYVDYSSPIPKMYSGMGSMHIHHTGTIEQIPLGEGFYLYPFIPEGNGALTWNGTGRVLETGTTAPEYQLTTSYVVAGNGKTIRDIIKFK